jgi:hypothetical protein
MTALLLRRASLSCSSGSWRHDDFDVFDGECNVGRIYLTNAFGNDKCWFWGVTFQLTGRKSYGTAESLDEAKAALKAEYGKWKASRS